MRAIDFPKSYATHFVKGGGSIARIQLDAACTIKDPRSGDSDVFYLIAPCRSEDMYLDDRLFKVPNYDWRGILSSEKHLILRKHWTNAPKGADEDRSERREYGDNQVKFDDVRLDVRYFEGSMALSTDQEIVKTTLANVPLNARTVVRDETTGVEATLEYPVKTMNVIRGPERFQVDTGPMLVPDFEATDGHQIQRLDVAYVVYNGFDKAELIRRRPTPVLAGGEEVATVDDYSVVTVLPAANEIFTAG